MQSNHRVSPFALWLDEMLRKRGLSGPDGRPLYRYRISDEEFESLEQLFQRFACGNVELLSKQRGFTACWFLYAAEWWKRRYQGGAWAWAPIMRGAGISSFPDPSMRNDWVSAGLHYWQLDSQAPLGKKYIGRVVTNGGVPLALLADGAGGVSRLLNFVQQEISSSRVAMSDMQILAAVTERAMLLPDSYRQSHILELLTEVLLIIRRLQTELGPSEEDPVSRLDRIHPGWIDEFPLQLEQSHARSLFGGLVRRSQADREQCQFQITRQIRFDSQGKPSRLETRLETTASIPIEKLLALMGMDESGANLLPAAMDLVLTASAVSRHAGKLLRRDGIFQIQVDGMRLPESWFQEDIELELSRYGQAIGKLELPGGEAPEPDQPWIFEDSMPVPRLLGFGNIRLRDNSCLVLHSAQAMVLHMQDDPLELGEFASRLLVRAGAGLMSITISKISYQVICADASAREPGTVVWYGKQLNNLIAGSSRVFLGDEMAFEVMPSGERRQIARSEIFWQFEAGEYLPVGGARQAGMGWLLWKRDGQIRHRVRAICLPSSAAIRIEPEENGGQIDGRVVLQGWPLSRLEAGCESAKVTIEQKGNDWVLTCQKTGQTPPVNLALNLKWPGGKSQQLAVPYPAEGAFVYADDGFALAVNRTLSVADLLGLSIRIQSSKPQRWKIDLGLQDCSESRLGGQTIPVMPSANESMMDIRLFELQDDVRQLLATVDELDAKVCITVSRSGGVCQVLQVGRYRDRLEREAAHVSLQIDESLPADDILKSTRMLAVPLLDPGRAPVELDAHHSELASTGRWRFDPDRHSAGVWLIYPAVGSLLDCRPIAWYVPEKFATPVPRLEGLRAAMVIQSRHERLAAMQSHFAAMANNPSHADWPLVEDYARQLGHLPLAGLDLWVALMRCPRAVIMALLRVEEFSERIAHRLSTELPFEWVLTSPQDWLLVVDAMVKTCDSNDPRELRMLKREIEAKLEWLRRLYPALELSINLALALGLSREKPEEVKMLLVEPKVLREEWLSRMLHGEHSDVQGLLRRASEVSRGPADLKSYTQSFAHTPDGIRVLHRFSLPKDDWKFSLAVAPLAIAYDIAEGRAPDWLDNRSRLVALRNYRSFDAHWFDEAYKVAMVCAFDDGLIKV